MSRSANEHLPKRLARLAAVQGLYQMALTQKAARAILDNFKEHPADFLGEAGNQAANAGIDSAIFDGIVLGVEQNANEIDELIAGSLDAKLSPERIEILLRSILRAGTYELRHHLEVPAAVIVNDYVDIAHAFFGAKEPGLVNGVLDRLAKRRG